MDFSDLTLIFFVRERQFNISKLTEYYSSVNARKVIYDSSKKPISNESIGELKSRDVEYVWVGPVPLS